MCTFFLALYFCWCFCFVSVAKIIILLYCIVVVLITVVLDYGLSEKDLVFIEEIIQGTEEKCRCGRSAEKFFLYDIVNNSRSGLDVDKLDYFQRDIRHTNVFTSHEQFQRFVEFGRVMPALPIDHSQDQVVVAEKSRLFSGLSRIQPDVVVSNEFKQVDNENDSEDDTNNDDTSKLFSSPAEIPMFHNISQDNINNGSTRKVPKSQPCYMICYPEKMVGEALQLFALRYHLHQKVYTHKTVKKVEYMVRKLMIFLPFHYFHSH